MRRVGGLFLFAILAGFCIGLGGTVFLRLKDAFPGGNVVGALLFTIGLFTICTRGYALFTGKACYLFQNPWPGISDTARKKMPTANNITAHSCLRERACSSARRFCAAVCRPVLFLAAVVFFFAAVLFFCSATDAAP